MAVLVFCFYEQYYLVILNVFERCDRKSPYFAQYSFWLIYTIFLNFSMSVIFSLMSSFIPYRSSSAHPFFPVFYGYRYYLADYYQLQIYHINTFPCTGV
jgi:hypothetical protein